MRHHNDVVTGDCVCWRPSHTVPKAAGPQADTDGETRPYWKEKAAEVAGRCACCGEPMDEKANVCPVCKSKKTRIG